MTEDLELNLLRAAARASRTGAWRFNLAENRVFWSEMTYTLFDVPQGEKIDLASGLSFYDGSSRTRIEAAVARCIENGTPWSIIARCRTRTGRWFWARSDGVAVLGADGKTEALEGAFQDISSERAAHEAKSLAENDLATLMETLPDGFFVLDTDWRFVFVNNASRTMLRRAPEELIGKNVWDEFPEAVGTMFETTYRAVMEDGAPRLFEANFEPLEKWFAVSAHRSPRGLAVHFRDVTVAKREEVQRTRVERDALLGQMAGGVSHDFNNLLSVVLGNAELLGEISDPTEKRELVDELRRAVRRGQALNDSLLAFAGRARLKEETEDITAFMRSIQPMIERTVSSRVALKFAIPTQAPTVCIDRAMVESCLLNLIFNARDAISGDGEIMIALSVTTRGKQPFVRLSVTDNGPGIPEEMREKVFEPFFTTKGMANGSGLGLARVKGYVEQAGGFVTIEGGQDIGTIVAMHFPAIDSQKAANAEEASRQRALVVDDTEAVARVTARLLSSMGFHVATAPNAGEARRMLADDPPWDVMITDVVMPGEDGLALARSVKAEFPNLSMVVMTGYQDATPDDDMDGLVFLRKPAGTDGLQSALERAGMSVPAR
ncbi:MAG: ATP-binding protein [Parvularcula sp.]|jgi:PAS domain S-box-containing protein|nr:ATP-binding protein [Parvularcula sp.]